MLRPFSKSNKKQAKQCNLSHFLALSPSIARVPDACWQLGEEGRQRSVGSYIICDVAGRGDGDATGQVAATRGRQVSLPGPPWY